MRLSKKPHRRISIARQIGTLGLLIFLASSINANAQSSSSFKINPKGIAGAAGAGVVLFDIATPTSQFTVDQGIYGSISGEKGLGALNLFLTLSLNYLQTEGQTAYNYTTLSGANYTGTDVPFKTQLFQGGLGFKFKLLPGWFRPYVEAGGLAGYFSMSYSEVATRVTGPGSDAKEKDALLDFGYYYEGGLEIAFSPEFGLKVAARFTDNKSKPFETLGDQSIDYKTEVYYLSLLKNF